MDRGFGLEAAREGKRGEGNRCDIDAPQQAASASAAPTEDVAGMRREGGLIAG